MTLRLMSAVFFALSHCVVAGSAAEGFLLKKEFCIGVYSESKKEILHDMTPEMLITEQTKKIIFIIDNEIRILSDEIVTAQNDKSVDSYQLFGAELAGREAHKRYMADAQRLCKRDSDTFSEQDDYIACADALHPDVGECRAALDRKWRATLKN